MKTLVYASQDHSIREPLNAYVKKQVNRPEMTVETFPLMLDWTERSLNSVLQEAEAGDTIVVYDASSIARSHIQVIDFLAACLKKNVNTTFLKYDLTFKATKVNNFMDLLNLTREIEGDFVSKRNIDAIYKRQEYGIVLGRPKGRKNKSLKLDKYKKDITRYLELSISKASIAKLVDCHPQTLYDWIERNEMLDSKPRKPRTKKTAMA